MKKFFFILRQGNKVIGASSFTAPTLDGLQLPQPDSGITREFVDEDPTHIRLPALWKDGKVSPLPEKPADHYVYNFSELVWEEDLSIIWETVRIKRNDLLAKTDIDIARIWEQEGQVVPPALIEYRQALRDITLQADPLNIIWPIPPTVLPVDERYPIFTGKNKLDIFSTEEQIAIGTASLSVPAVKLVYDRFLSAVYVTYEDPEVEYGLNILMEAGLLSPERKAEIVTSLLPPAQRSV